MEESLCPDVDILSTSATHQGVSTIDFSLKIQPRRSPAKVSTLLSSPKVEADADTKPDIKPSPTKNIAIFDTAAASSPTAAGSEAGPSSSSSKPLDTPLFSFSPAQDVSFGSHTRVPFSFPFDALVLLSSTKSRLFIQLVLTNLLRAVIELDPESLLSVVYLCSNRIGPSYGKDTELGIGWHIAFEASKSVRLRVKPTPLECHGVYKILTQIAKLKGPEGKEPAEESQYWITAKEQREMAKVDREEEEKASAKKAKGAKGKAKEEEGGGKAAPKIKKKPKAQKAA
ncbi:hypothetical protein JCM10021v2_004261 [Rhodotorula toruloides]